MSPFLIFFPTSTKLLAPGSGARYAVPIIGLLTTFVSSIISFDVDSFGGKKATLFVKGTGIIDIPASQGKNFLAVVKKLRDSDFK